MFNLHKHNLIVYTNVSLNYYICRKLNKMKVDWRALVTIAKSASWQWTQQEMLFTTKLYEWNCWEKLHKPQYADLSSFDHFIVTKHPLVRLILSTSSSLLLMTSDRNLIEYACRGHSNGKFTNYWLTDFKMILDNHDSTNLRKFTISVSIWLIHQIDT